MTPSSPLGPVNAAHRGRGFTLVEMVMAIIVLAVLAAVTTPMMLQGILAYQATYNSLQTLDKLRYATERLAREIRETDRVAGVYTISMATTPPLTFTKADGTGVTVSAGGTLSLSYATPAVSAVLTDEYTTLAIAYFDANGASTTSASDVRYVELTLTLTNPASGQVYSQRTRAMLRDRS